MIDYAGNQIKPIKGCLSCAFSDHQFSLPCGTAYEDNDFIINQDWELPIPGFFILASKQHKRALCDFTDAERNKMFDLINRTIKILKQNNICSQYNVIFEEKPKLEHHFHVWIMPRHQWMQDLVGDIVDHIGQIFDYAKANMRTPENFQKINHANQILKSALNS